MRTLILEHVLIHVLLAPTIKSMDPISYAPVDVILISMLISPKNVSQQQIALLLLFHIMLMISQISVLKNVQWGKEPMLNNQIEDVSIFVSLASMQILPQEDVLRTVLLVHQDTMDRILHEYAICSVFKVSFQMMLWVNVSEFVQKVHMETTQPENV